MSGMRSPHLCSQDPGEESPCASAPDMQACNRLQGHVTLPRASSLGVPACLACAPTARSNGVHQPSRLQDPVHIGVSNRGRAGDAHNGRTHRRAQCADANVNQDLVLSNAGRTRRKESSHVTLLYRCSSIRS